MQVRTLGAAAILAGALAVSATAADAAVVFDFGVGPNGVTTSSWAGNQGQTHTYTASGLTIIASAFGPARNGAADQLYGKHSGGDENGLGMTNDPSGDHEIYYGKGFVQLDVSALYTARSGSDVLDPRSSAAPRAGSSGWFTARTPPGPWARPLFRSARP